MDPVSLTLGIIPLLGGSMKMYKSAYERLRLFRHYSREVDRVRKQFTRQKQFFLNEVHLILYLVLEYDFLADEMLGDAEHDRWHSAKVESHMSRFLGAGNCSVLKDIVEDIVRAISESEKELECFDCLEKRRKEASTKGERLKDAVKRLRDGVKIAFDKTKFDKWIEKLRNYNEDLKRLREQSLQLSGSTVINFRRHDRKRLPVSFKAFGATRTASRALHDALLDTLSRQDAAHFRHLIRLFLDSKTDEGVQLDLSILCLSQDFEESKVLSHPTVIQIHVRSHTLDWIDGRVFTAVLGSEQREESRRKRVKVRFEDDGSSSDKESAVDPVIAEAAGLKQTSLDLRNSRHICAELVSSDPGRLTNSSEKPFSGCIGHIDTCSHEKYRHSFFQCCEGVCRPGLCGQAVATGTVKRLDEILEHSYSDKLSVLNQLQLAFRIASAVLKFNSTPWMSEHWGLKNLSFFWRDQDLPTSLETLHIGVELTKKVQQKTGAVMEVDPSPDVSAALEEAEFTYGIRNITLYNLGVVLLSIARWAPVDPNDVVKVRSLASRVCPLGPRYQEVMQRALDCDFAYGKDLAKPRLQEAIYDGVLLELESMVSSLSLEEPAAA